MKETLKSWSFSKLIVFEECKYRAKLQWLDKVPDLQPKTAADRGTQIHQEAEDYVLGKSGLTHNLRHFEDDFAALAEHAKSGRVTCEQEWGFDDQWNPTEWRRAWLRLKADAVCHLDATHAVVVDFKSGRRFGNEIKHARQLQLYAVCALILYPDLEQVTCELWYLDIDMLESFSMNRKQLPKYLKIFDRSGREFTKETEFKPNANIYSCKYCPYHPNKQGDCTFGVSINNTITQRQSEPIPIVDASKFAPMDISEFKNRV